MVRALDKAGNLQTPEVSATTFTFSMPDAQVGFTRPIKATPSKFYTDLLVIDGTANDTNGNTRRTEVMVTRNSDYAHWSVSGSSWGFFGQAISTFNTLCALDAGCGAWSMNAPAGWKVDGASYTVTIRGWNAVPVQTDVTSDFTFDTQKPVSVTTQPSNSGFTTQLTAIAGTVGDQVDMALPKQVRIGVNRFKKPDGTADDFYWDGSTWTAGWDPSLDGRYNSANMVGVDVVKNWTYAINFSSMILEGYGYKIVTKAMDNAYRLDNIQTGNEESNPPGFPTLTATYDVQNPTPTLTSITDGSVLTAVSIVSGTVADIKNAGFVNSIPGRGQVQDVQIVIKDNSTNKYWDGAANNWGENVGEISSNSVTMHAAPIGVVSTSWTYTSPGQPLPVLQDGRKYTIYSVAKDYAGNLYVLFTAGTSSVTFTADRSSPTSVIAIPANNSKITIASLTNITGTSADPIPAGNQAVAGVAQSSITVFYLQGSVTYYWNGADFVNSPTFVDDIAWKNTGIVTAWTSSRTWEYTAINGLNKWSSDKTYKIRVRARDNGYPLNHVETPYSEISVIVDTTPPTSAVGTPSASAINVLTQITGTANADLAGLSGVELTIQQAGGTNDGKYWDGAAWTATITSITMNSAQGSGTLTWSTASLVTGSLELGSTYTVKVYATDLVAPTPNSQKDGPTPAVSTFLFDNRTATVTITDPDGPRESSLPFISGSATTTAVGGALTSVQVRIFQSSGTAAWWNAANSGANAQSFDPTLAANSAWFEATTVNGYTTWTTTQAAEANQFADDFQYSVQARSFDRGVAQTGFAASTFTFDINKIHLIDPVSEMVL